MSVLCALCCTGLPGGRDQGLCRSHVSEYVLVYLVGETKAFVDHTWVNMYWFTWWERPRPLSITREWICTGLPGGGDQGLCRSHVSEYVLVYLVGETKAFVNHTWVNMYWFTWWGRPRPLSITREWICTGLPGGGDQGLCQSHVNEYVLVYMVGETKAFVNHMWVNMYWFTWWGRPRPLSITREWICTGLHGRGDQGLCQSHVSEYVLVYMVGETKAFVDHTWVNMYWFTWWGKTIRPLS